MTFYLIMILITFIATYITNVKQKCDKPCQYAFVCSILWPIFWIGVIIDVVKTFVILNGYKRTVNKIRKSNINKEEKEND